MSRQTKKNGNKSNAERARAKYLRRKRATKLLTRAETAWLDSYERETRRVFSQFEDLTREEAAARGGRPSPASVPIHRAEQVAGDGPDRFASIPMLPPAAPEVPSSASTGGVASDAPPGGAAGGATAGGSPSSGGEAEPLFEGPAAAPPDPAVLEAGAERFAAAVVAVNALGLAALLELFPEGSLPVPPSLEAAARSREAHAALLGGLHASAVQLARQHPWLCAVGPSPAVVVIGSTGISLTALWFRHLRPLVQGETRAAVEVGPAPSSAPNGARAGAPPPPPPPPPPGDGLDFRRLL